MKPPAPATRPDAQAALMLWLEAFNAGDEPALTSFHAKHTTADLAYGFGESVEDGVRCSGHAGGAGGMNGELQICSSGYTIAVLANVDPPVAMHLMRFIRYRLPNR